MKLSLMAFIFEGTPSLAWMTVCTFTPPFFLPDLGWRPAPLKMRLENSVTVVEPMICRRLSREGTCRLGCPRKVRPCTHTPSRACACWHRTMCYDAAAFLSPNGRVCVLRGTSSRLSLARNQKRLITA